MSDEDRRLPEDAPAGEQADEGQRERGGAPADEITLRESPPVDTIAPPPPLPEHALPDFGPATPMSGGGQRARLWHRPGRFLLLISAIVLSRVP